MVHGIVTVETDKKKTQYYYSPSHERHLVNRVFNFVLATELKVGYTKKNLVLLLQNLTDQILAFKKLTKSISHLASSITKLLKLMRFRQMSLICNYFTIKVMYKLFETCKD